MTTCDKCQTKISRSDSTVVSDGTTLTRICLVCVNSKQMANTDCPKCGSENSLVGSSHLKWGKTNKWQHFLNCQACKYEQKVD